jgi:hypothetical protein
MKKFLVVAAGVVSLLAATMSPAHAAKSLSAQKGPTGTDCPIFKVAVGIQEPRLVNSQPFNLAFGAEIGDHKAIPMTSCATFHNSLKVAYYLYLLPINGPRTLIATDNNTGFCFDCDDVISVSSSIVPPGIYELVGDFFIDGVQVTSVTTPNFLYDGFDVAPFAPFDSNP